MKVVDRLIKYAKFDTQSDDHSVSSPSTKKQLVLLDYLEKELKELGLQTRRTTCGYVFATLEKNNSNSSKKLAFLAHVDTSPAVSGENVKPQILKFTGEDVLLNKEKGIYFPVESFPEIKQYIGQDIIFTDGTTLLGADDKAGVAEIVTAIEYLLSHKEISHPEIRVAFTTDEEIGRGTDGFDVNEFGADFGYTVDGGALGDLNYENFNAASGLLEINGISVHPGDALGKMINAIDVFNEFHALLPTNERPNTTKDYQGFFMASEVGGGVDHFTARYIIRDHDMDIFRSRCKRFEECGKIINEKYGKNIVSATVKDSYFNMKEIIKNNYHLVDNAKQAYLNCGIEPLVSPIRGGTDGANLSFMGMPTPNIATGGHNFHGRFEYIPVNSMSKMVEVIVELAKLYA